MTDKIIPKQGAFNSSRDYPHHKPKRTLKFYRHGTMLLTVETIDDQTVMFGRRLSGDRIIHKPGEEVIPLEGVCAELDIPYVSQTNEVFA